jgi:WD40 repeat protein
MVEGTMLAKFTEDAPISSIEFHPDGLVLAVGLKTGAIKVYDIRDQKVAMELQGPIAGASGQST